MDDSTTLIIILVLVVVLIAITVLPIVALVIAISSRAKLNRELVRLRGTPLTSESVEQIRVHDLAPLARAVQQLETRTARIETALGARDVELPAVVTPPPEPPRAAAPIITPAPPPEIVPQPPVVPTPPTGPPPAPIARAAQIESVIGRRWLGWVAVALILFATAFFLKYAFDNRWIGELGRVTIGVSAGVSLTLLGHKYYGRGWRIFAQILTAGGIVLLYLSAYAAFGYYHLATQKTAFIYLAILVAEAAGLALLYDAPGIAIMALIGGFLAPVLLRSDRDQYRSLFGYLALLDLGTLFLLKPWMGLAPLAFVGTHLLFWLWYEEAYHPRKLSAVMVFQSGVFAIFLLARLGRRLLRREPAPARLLSRITPASFLAIGEDLGMLLINPFVFFASAYYLLDHDHHEWMGAFAILMALIYACLARLLWSQSETNRVQVLIMIAIATTFVTVAIPVQLHANWITIGWAVEALAILWAGLKMESKRLELTAWGLFLLALGRLVLVDTVALQSRSKFTPILNKYFLSSVAVIGCFFAASVLIQKSRQKVFAARLEIVFMLVALTALWFVMSVETFTYFQTKAEALKFEMDQRHELWLGQMALSVLWSVYAAALMAMGFVRRAAAIRWAALGLFAVTVIKVMMVDIAVLQQLYRIIAFFVLGLLLLVVAWGYHKASQSQEAPQ
jgi:uncharacterized membrane protein